MFDLKKGLKNIKNEMNIKDFVFTGILLLVAYFVSLILLQHTGEENNSALVFMVTVVVVARFTKGYVYGIIASCVAVFCANYYFMYPFAEFNVQISGYPVALVSFLMCSIIVSMLTSRTITQSQQNERLYKERAEAKMASEKERIRGNLLRSISHDLRTPITGIIGSSDVIITNADNLSKDEIRSMASNIREDAQWLIDVMENMLSITRVSGEAAELKKSDEFPEEIIGVAIAKIRKRYPNVKINAKLNDEIITVPMDPLLIEQVIINLIENSIKHAEGMETISIEYYKKGIYTVFEIKDDGGGFAYKNVDELIEAKLSQKIEKTDGSKNAGIGLSVCKSIVLAHKGIFQAENLSEGGSVFRFSLPGKE